MMLEKNHLESWAGEMAPSVSKTIALQVYEDLSLTPKILGLKSWVVQQEFRGAEEAETSPGAHCLVQLPYFITPRPVRDPASKHKVDES